VGIAEKMLQGSNEKRPEPPPLGIGRDVTLFLQQTGKEALSQVFGFGFGIALSPEIGKYRKPVGLAQFRECLVALGSQTAVAGGQHHRPAGGREKIRRQIAC